MNEEFLRKEIIKAEKTLEEISLRKKHLAQQLMEQETIYGETKLHLDLAKEELRRLNLRTVTYSPSERELDIERFREILPELMKKLANNLES